MPCCIIMNGIMDVMKSIMSLFLPRRAMRAWPRPAIASRNMTGYIQSQLYRQVHFCNAT